MKIRGFRVELGEIEAALQSLDGVRSAVVVARPQPTGDKELAAFCSGDPRALEPEALLTTLARLLPAHFVPSSLVVLEALPLDPNGKPDRRALAQMREPTPEQKPSDEPCVTPTEKWFAQQLADLYGAPKVGRHDDFFFLGGHSLGAMRLAARVLKEFRVTLTIQDVFDRRTVAAMAAAVDERRAKATANEEPKEAAPLATDLTWSVASSAQERLWFLEQLTPGLSVYGSPFASRIHGRVDVDALKRAFAVVVDRHEAFRTRFAFEAGVVIQRVTNQSPALAVHPGPMTPEEVSRFIQEAVARPFDLTAGPLLRAHLLCEAEDRFALLVDVHHVIMDAVSLNVFFEELETAYRALQAGEDAQLPKVGGRYLDFATWQRSWMNSPEGHEQLAAWKQALDGAPHALELPIDRPRPPDGITRGDYLRFTLPADLGPRIAPFAREHDATAFMLLFAVFGDLLARLSGQDDLMIGTTVAGRTLAEYQRTVGLFVNTLPLRVQRDPRGSFLRLLAHVRATSLAALGRQDVALESIVRAVNASRQMNRTPLFQVVFELVGIGQRRHDFAGLPLEELARDSSRARFELRVSFQVDAEGRYEGHLEYASEIFDRARAESIARMYETLLRAHLDSPETPLETAAYLPADLRAEVLRSGVRRAGGIRGFGRRALPAAGREDPGRRRGGGRRRSSRTASSKGEPPPSARSFASSPPTPWSRS